MDAHADHRAIANCNANSDAGTTNCDASTRLNGNTRTNGNAHPNPLCSEPSSRLGSVHREAWRHALPTGVEH